MNRNSPSWIIIITNELKRITSKFLSFLLEALSLRDKPSINDDKQQQNGDFYPRVQLIFILSVSLFTGYLLLAFRDYLFGQEIGKDEHHFDMKKRFHEEEEEDIASLLRQNKAQQPSKKKLTE
eukprot:CAMPEP_0195531322 /NCGR_PEP_ID=MMETSP0794_2-20130614/35041_1 /TAXON_ID=515487 /ORGANISM="Stephanopyxis turris, Strain CCMP 815" /LENGTH=122 /DNA_ID=CAMNT_0040663071 /DNA_START=63 /DNA_END=431 /DNA_ORIENTATION=+